MKKIFITAIIIFSAAISMAQVKFNLIVNAQPPAQLSEWGNKREVLMVLVTAQGAIGAQYKVKTEIKTMDGTVIASADLAKVPVFTPSPPPGTTILTANDVMPLEFMVFTGKYKTSLQRTGKLPADNYTICVRPVNITDYTPMGEEQCKNFYLATTQLPILMKPYNEEVLDAKKAQTAITFRWTPVVPRPTDPVSYRLQVFEVLADQNPMQALRSNQPLLDKEIMGTTQYIWRPQLSFMICCRDGDVTGDEKNINTSEAGLGSGKDNKSAQKNINTSEAGLGSGKDNKTRYLVKRFIWTIQSLDSHANPVTQTDGNGEARSEPMVFFVDPNKNNPPQKKN